MSNRISTVEPGSPAARAGVRPGESLLRVNGHPILDVLDYKYHAYDPRLTLTLGDGAGAERQVTLRKGEGEDLGLEFDHYLMDKARSCANRCIFCFVDQMPPGMRETLYFKDDDARLSFLMGNYITMTNLSRREVERICELRVSPINISVHATEPELRQRLLGHRSAGRCLELMERFARAGITMNCQIVACPGINDGAHLQRTMEDLAGLHPAVNSVSVVPVGITKFREGLYPLRPYTPEEAAALLEQVEAFGAQCRQRLGTTLVWCSDEFYLKAGRPLPGHEYYEEYTQLENGVGMLRLLRREAELALSDPEDGTGASPYAIATGVSAAPFLEEIAALVRRTCGGPEGKVYPVVNRFFGETITVAGLITGGDLIAQLKGKDLGRRLLIPSNMLRAGERVFLDDVTVEQVEQALGVPVTAVEQDGYELVDAILQRESGGGEVCWLSPEDGGYYRYNPGR